MNWVLKMRNSFAKHINTLTKRNKKIHLLVGDIGFKVFDDFVKNNNKNFLNAGIAEANMIGVSAGMAMVGLKPIVYTIIPFLTMRPFEQIRVDICLHNLPVILVGVGGGLAYDTLGPTHHSIEDISIMRSLPNMNVFTPSDPDEVKKSLDLSIKLKAPCYIRLGKGGESNIKELLKVNNVKNNTPIYKTQTIQKVISKKKSKKVVFTYGPIISNCIKAISGCNENLDLYSFLSLKPFNEKLVRNLLKKYYEVICVEEHSLIGGLTSVISMIIAKYNLNLKFRYICINDKFIKDIGTREHLLKKNLLDPSNLKKQFSYSK